MINPSEIRKEVGIEYARLLNFVSSLLIVFTVRGAADPLP